MHSRRPMPVQLSLHLANASPLSLDSGTRQAIIQLLAQLLANVSEDPAHASDPEASDETR